MSEESGKSTRVSEAEVRRAHAERENIKQARDAEQTRLEGAQKQRLKACRRALFFRGVLRCRQFCDHSITRRGGFVNVLIVGSALAVVGASLMGYSGYRMPAVLAGSLIAAPVAALLLLPGDAAVASGITGWEQDSIALAAVMADAQGKVDEHENRLVEADALYRRLLAVYLSRRNQLLHSRWPEMTGVDFENFLASVFQELGYEVRTTTTADDKGVDMIVSKNSRKVAIQARGCPRSTVGNEAVRELRTGMLCYECQDAVLITNSDFTPAAGELAATVGCRVIAGHQMRDLIEGRIIV